MKNVKILILDDEKELLNALKRSFHRFKQEYHIDISTTVTDAYTKIRDGEYDVVFFDYNMPYGNGATFLDLCNTIPNKPKLILFSGYGNDQTVMDLVFSLGACDIMTKPASVKDIIDKIELHIGN